MSARLTTEQVASQLHVEVATVCRWAAAGKVRAAKVGLRWLFTQADVDAFVAKAFATSSAAPVQSERRRRRRSA